VITLGSSLVRLDYEVLPEPGPPAPSASGFSSSALAPFPRAVTLLTDLSEPWGVVSDPLASHSIYLAERTFPRADGGVGRVSHVELDSYIRRAVFLAPSTPLEGGFERPTAIALEAHGARLLALTDALGDDDRELRGIEIGGRAPGVVFEPARELGTAASLATGPDGLRLVALPTENDLAVAGGVEQRRTIAGYDRARAVVAVSEPFEPAPRANAPWRIEGTLAAAPSSPQGRSSVFVWDSADVLEADVFLRVVPLDTDRGLGDDSLVAKRVRAFGDPAVLITGNSLNVDAADVNGDGRLDLVSTGTRFSGPPSGVLVYLQLQGPSGGFDPSPSLSFGIGRGWSWARAEDLDGDGDTDLVGMRSTKHEGGDLFGGAGEDPTTVDALLVFLQPVTGFIGADPEAGRPGQAPDYRLGLALPQKLDDTQQFDVADFDRNGRLDLVLACASVGITRPIPPPVGAVALWYGGTPDLYSANPDELLRSEIRFETWVRQTSSSDMNGDGLLDLVLPTRLGIDVRFQHPDGGPPSGPPELFSIRDLLLASDPGPAPGCFAGDANGDGRIDLVSHGIGAGGDGDLEIYFQGGAGLAGDSMASSLGRHGGGYGVAADVDGDGRQDLVLPGFAQNRVEILLQSGRGRFPSGSSNVLLPVQFPSGVVTPDLNGDGRLDLAVAQFDGPNTLTVWQAGAPGRFAATPDQALTTFGQIGRPVSLAAADLDGDGRQDLVAAGADHSGSFGQSPGGLGLYHQRSSGTYSSVPDSIVHARASGFRALVAADLDGDGRVDLACANAGPRNLTVFLQGEGDPAFADEPTQVLGGPLVTRDPRGLTAADLDGDGSLDLVSADNASDDLTVFYQKPTGFADKPVRLGGGVATDGPGTLAAADLDSDGRVDLAVADANGRNGAVFYQPPGGFVSPGPPAVLLQATRPVIYIAVQDVDGDGLLDMILQSSGLGGLGGVLVFYQPRPRFHSTSTAGVEIPFAGTGSVLRATDLDGNGSVDVALASTRDSEAGIHLFFQRPSGFPASADLVLAKEPVNLHVDLLAADLSGDGEIDLASVLQRSPRPDGVVADQILLFFSGK
jgi:hypothetical protein